MTIVAAAWEAWDEELDMVDADDFVETDELSLSDWKVILNSGSMFWKLITKGMIL